MHIRNVREADFTECFEIARRAWPEFHERESIYHLFCKFFSNTSFIGEANAVTVAFLLGFISQVDREQGYIHLVAVEPAAQRTGAARELYERFFGEVGQLGVREVRLIVNPDNAASLAFHRKLGFTADLHGPTTEVDNVIAVKDYNGPGIHMVPFYRKIDSPRGRMQ
jgi:ribosomal protein S18 acetylase RimI-like enzyme